MIKNIKLVIIFQIIKIHYIEAVKEKNELINLKEELGKCTNKFKHRILKSRMI
jgi:hypothetical protein